PVTPPVVDEGGKIDPPKPVEPDKPTPPPSGGGSTPTISETVIDEIIAGGITNVNTKISQNGAYATLSTLGTNNENNKVTVTITKGTELVSKVGTDIVQILIDALKANSNQVSTLTAGTATLTPGTADATAIQAFVVASGLKNAAGSAPISATDAISDLNGQTLTVTVNTVYNDHYAYAVKFVDRTPNESKIDEIIIGGITNVNNVLKVEGKQYAELGALGTEGENNKVVVTIKTGTITVANVYNDIITVLLNSLSANSDMVKTIACGTETLTLSEAITGQQVEDFVKASGLQGASGAIKGSDTISVLDKKSLAATVTDVNGGTYIYTISFANKAV
ncbi:MAG: hypothetical protein RSB55_04415, partial [Oscillospiraceae bacterium]